MHLTVVNLSTSISPEEFQATIRVLAQQVSVDFQPEWGVGATLLGITSKLDKHRLAPIQGNRDAMIYLGDSSSDPTTGVDGALGYHSINHKHVPYGFVYLDICKEYGEVWTCTLSHEVLELLGDPTAVMTVTGPAPKGGSRFVHYDLEVCDPTQGDSYAINGVVVSNFVGRSYFELPGGSGKTNFLDLELKPFGVRPKGYFQYEDRAGTHQVDGERVTPDMKKAKEKMKDARRNARRAARSAE
ncbi:MAG TPA: hypothetical protein VIY30_14135 [Burkholderiaceae bacterium]